MIMNNKLLTMLMAALFPAFCAANGNPPAPKAVTKGYNSIDARSWGLSGKVKSVTSTLFEAWPGESGLVRGNEKSDHPVLMCTFDENGRVTLDQMDNIYVYDKKGNFVKGNSEFAKMTRDANGRVATYDCQEDEEDYTQWHSTFGYDAQGRLITLSTSYWEALSEDTLYYEGDKLWPVRMVREEQAEADFYKYEITYRYTKSDSQGNWTEREIHTKTFSRCEADDDDPGTIEYTYEIEVRALEYWE